MNGEHLDWDNLRYFLAVARAGKLTAAARRLGQYHTTVGRRIANLESAFHSKLFERRPDGYRLTEAGQRLYKNVDALESSIWEIQRNIAGRTQHIEGLVRIGAPDDFGNLFLAKHLGELQSLHPGLKIELITLPYTLSVSKREADIAISIERPVEGRLFVRKLTDFEMRLYATRDYIDAHGPIDGVSDLTGQMWIGCVGGFSSAALPNAATEFDCTPTLRLTCSSFAGQLAAAGERRRRRPPSSLRRRSGSVLDTHSLGCCQGDASLSHGGARRSARSAKSSDSGALHRAKGGRRARALHSYANPLRPIKSSIPSHLAHP